MNIFFLAAGQSTFDAGDSGYPLCLAEFDGVPLLERLVAACQNLPAPNFVFAIRAADMKRWHLASSVLLLSPGAHIVSVPEETGGAACTALLAVELIDNGEELLIISANQLVDVDLSEVVTEFRQRNLDAGTVVFPSIHPRYSYVRLDESALVVEAAEKRPVSRHATAGIYWFARGRNFVKAAKSMIAKDAHSDGKFYVCPTFNELVLEGARIGVVHIDAAQYHPLKSERQLRAYEAQTGVTQLR